MRSIRKSGKLRRHSGRRFPRLIYPVKEIEPDLQPQEYWNDWKDYRDGVRGTNDRKMLRNRYASFSRYFKVDKWNSKLKKLIWRRYARKIKMQYLKEMYMVNSKFLEKYKS